MLRNTQWLSAALALCAVSLVGSSAGAQTQSKQTEIRDFEVMAVDGNHVAVKTAEGSKEITVPEGFKFTVDGKQVGVHDLKPGMHGSATITTTTTVVPVQTTEVRNGTVMRRTGNTLIVRTEDGVRMFSEADVRERNATINRNGQPARIGDLREGDRLTATIVTTHPPKVLTEREVEANLKSPAPARAHAPAAGAESTPESTTASAAGGAAKKLPKTGSAQPLIGALGVGLLAAGMTLTLRRRRQS